VPRIAGTLSLAFGLLGGIVASQGPEYAQQYRQRLGGTIDELRRMVTQFDVDARATGQTREGAVERLRTDRDDFLRRRGDAMHADVQRLERLERQRDSFNTAGAFARLGVLVRDADTDLARAAFGDYEPAVPTTSEGLVMAGVGFVLGWLLSRLIAIPLRRLFVRRRRTAQPA
jgi:hypothetical protein